MNQARLALFALPVVLAAIPMIACGSTDSSGAGTMAGSSGSAENGSSTTTNALHGTYVPVGDITKAEFARLTFSNATDYSYVRANCSSSCSASGTYVFDGAKDLALRDGVTGAVEHVAFSGVKTGIADSFTQRRANLGRGIGILSTNAGDDDDDDSSGSMPGTGSGSSSGGLVSSAGSLLGDGGGALIASIVQAIMNGILMALENQGDAGASGDDDDSSGDGSACGSPAVVIACFAMGGTFTAGADGSCSCQMPDGGTADAMP